MHPIIDVCMDRQYFIWLRCIGIKIFVSDISFAYLSKLLKHSQSMRRVLTTVKSKCSQSQWWLQSNAFNSSQYDFQVDHCHCDITVILSTIHWNRIYYICDHRKWQEILSQWFHRGVTVIWKCILWRNKYATSWSLLLFNLLLTIVTPQ